MLTVTGQAIQCVFEAQGTSMTGTLYYFWKTMSLSDCQNACSSDIICLAFTHYIGLNHCCLHKSTETKTISPRCTDCTYYLKLCTSTTSMSTFLCLFCCCFFCLLFVQTNRTVCLLFHVDI